MEIKKVKLKNGTTMYFKEVNGELIEVEASELCKRFIPKKNEDFWYVNVDGVVEKEKNEFFYPYNSEDNNCFRTKEEALRKKEIIDFIYSKRKLFTREEWKTNIVCKWFINTNTHSSYLCLGQCWQANSSLYHFETQEIAQEVSNFVGYEDWIKYVLNIYED